VKCTRKCSSDEKELDIFEGEETLEMLITCQDPMVETVDGSNVDIMTEAKENWSRCKRRTCSRIIDRTTTT
jgi:hypothetical protein